MKKAYTNCLCTDIEQSVYSTIRNINSSCYLLVVIRMWFNESWTNVQNHSLRSDWWIFYFEYHVESETAKLSMLLHTFKNFDQQKKYIYMNCLVLWIWFPHFFLYMTRAHRWTVWLRIAHRTNAVHLKQSHLLSSLSKKNIYDKTSFVFKNYYNCTYNCVI